MSVRDARGGAALTPEELTERLGELLAVGSGAAAAASLGAALAAAPVSTALLLAAAGALRPRAVAFQLPPNRAAIDVVDATDGAHGLVDAGAAAALLVAACDGTVAHQRAPGRQEALLEALGVPVDLEPRRARAALDWCGFAVLAPARFHPGLARILPVAAAAPRFFALLTPLLHPAAAARQVVTVSDPTHTGPLVEALVECGAEAALVVYAGGAPFLSPHAEAVGHAWRDKKRRAFHQPRGRATPEDLLSAGADEDAARVRRIFGNAAGGAADPLGDAVALTAGAALWIGDHLPSFAEGHAWAQDRLGQGIKLGEVGAVEKDEAAATSRSRTAPAPGATSPRSPRPPRAAARPGRGRKE